MKENGKPTRKDIFRPLKTQRSGLKIKKAISDCRVIPKGIF